MKMVKLDGQIGPKTRDLETQWLFYVVRRKRNSTKMADEKTLSGVVFCVCFIVLRHHYAPPPTARNLCRITHYVSQVVRYVVFIFISPTIVCWARRRFSSHSSLVFFSFNLIFIRVFLTRRRFRKPVARLI